MEIPIKILKTIKKIESLGSSLQLHEKELYEWLEKKGMDPEHDEPEGEYSLDNCMDFLMHSHDGSDLIEYLRRK